MNCVATLLTKSRTKFLVEYHSSCLEKTVKTQEGENMEHSEGSIKVLFRNQIELTPIISDPEYLLDQHILISVKSTDSDESYGEGCVALRAAQGCYTEFFITLTHHGEKTGTFTGGIQLHTSEGKPTEKLYDFIKIEKDDAAKGKGSDLNKSVTQAHDISNPNYMGLLYQKGNMVDKGWSYLPKKAGHDVGTRSTSAPLSNPVGEAEKPSEMFDNPLYGSMAKSQDHPHREPPALPEPAAEPDRPPVPTPRNRSYTCSDGKPQPPAPLAAHHYANKKPVVPSRSEGAMSHGRPPLPTKSRPGVAEPPASKPRDYRDNFELPAKRLPARPGQSSAHRDGQPEVPKRSVL